MTQPEEFMESFLTRQQKDKGVTVEDYYHNKKTDRLVANGNQRNHLKKPQ